ncbi:MAG: YciI family protein [Halothiobacillus sp.]
MYFAIIATDAQDSLAQRLAYRAEHRARLDELAQAKRLITAGPMPHAHHQTAANLSFGGSLIIADFADLAAAQAWANADPYVAHGVYQSVQVQPYLATYWGEPINSA